MVSEAFKRYQNRSKDPVSVDMIVLKITLTTKIRSNLFFNHFYMKKFDTQVSIFNTFFIFSIHVTVFHVGMVKLESIKLNVGILWVHIRTNLIQAFRNNVIQGTKFQQFVSKIQIIKFGQFTKFSIDRIRPKVLCCGPARRSFFRIFIVFIDSLIFKIVNKICFVDYLLVNSKLFYSAGFLLMSGSCHWYDQFRVKCLFWFFNRHKNQIWK